MPDESQASGAAGTRPDEHDRAFAARLDHLFKTVLQETQAGKKKEYSCPFVARALQQYGITVTGSYLWQLRRCVRWNADKKIVYALEKFFQVHPGYLYGAETPAQQSANPGTLEMRIKGRISGISEQGKEAILAIVENIRTMEGLTTEDPPLNSPQQDL